MSRAFNTERPLVYKEKNCSNPNNNNNNNNNNNEDSSNNKKLPQNVCDEKFNSEISKSRALL